MSTLAPRSCAASAAQNAALPAPTTITSAALSGMSSPSRHSVPGRRTAASPESMVAIIEISARIVVMDSARPLRGLRNDEERSLRRLGGAAMRLRPRGRILHELFHFPELAFVELAALLRRLEHVPPGGERVQGDAEIAQDFFAFGKDVVEEEDEAVLDHGAGLAQRLAEIDLAAPVGGHVFDQQHAVTLLEMALDLRVAAKTLRLLAHILHRQHQPIRHPGGKRDAGGFAAGDAVELLEADVALQ